MEAAIRAEHERVKQLVRLRELAQSYGIDINLDAAVATGTPVAVVSKQLTDAMAEASEAIAIHSRSSVHTAQQANTADGWEASLQRVAAKRGLSLAH